MKKPFGKGSWSRVERSIWEIWYGPIKKTYNEIGLEFYISPKDVEFLEQTISVAAASIGVTLAGVFGSFAAFVPIAVSYFIKNDDGSLNIHIAPHGLQVGIAPAADPNVFAPVQWLPVRLALEKLNRGPTEAMHEIGPSDALVKSAVAYHGVLVGALPEQQEGIYALDPIWEGSADEMSVALERLGIPEEILSEIHPSANCVGSATSKCTKEWGDACILPNFEVGRWVTLTCVFKNPDGKECDRQTRTWCSPGSPV